MASVEHSEIGICGQDPEALRQDTQIKQAPFDEITDPEFRAFIEDADAHFVPVNEDFFDLARSLEHVTGAFCPDMEGAMQKKLYHLSRQIKLLITDEIFEAKNVRTSEIREGVVVASRDDLLFAITYLYARKKREDLPISNSKKRDRVLSIETAVSLWGESSVGSKARDFLADLERKREENRQNLSGRGVEDRPTEKKPFALPPENPEYEEITMEVLQDVRDAARKKFPFRYWTSEHYVTASELGLSHDVMKAIELVDCFGTPRMDDFRLEDEKFILADADRKIRNTINRIQNIENNAIRQNRGDLSRRRATLQTLFAPRRAIMMERGGK